MIDCHTRIVAILASLLSNFSAVCSSSVLLACPRPFLIVLLSLETLDYYGVEALVYMRDVQETDECRIAQSKAKRNYR